MTHPIRTLLLARAVAYLNRYHLEDGALPWDEHHAEVHDLVEMIQGAAIEVTEYELTDVARDALRVPSRATSDAPAERFEPLEALRRIAAWCAKRGTSHESCDEALDSIYAIACTSRSIADRSTSHATDTKEKR